MMISRHQPSAVTSANNANSSNPQVLHQAGGSSKRDPVLSSFSPVGNSKFRDEAGGLAAAPVGQIQPRTATPVHSTSMANNVISAASSDNEELSLSRESYYQTPFSGEDLKGSSENLKRFSISGRLSLQKPPPPITPIPSQEVSNERLIRERFTGSKLSEKNPIELSNHNHNNNYYHSTIEKNLELNNRMVQVPSATATAPTSISTIAPAPTSISTTNRMAAESSFPMPSLEMIKNLVERSITDAMQEIRNDVQNLHVDLIKQNLAQQNLLYQIISSLPDGYKKLADDYHSLREENERLCDQWGVGGGGALLLWVVKTLPLVVLEEKYSTKLVKSFTTLLVVLFGLFNVSPEITIRINDNGTSDPAATSNATNSSGRKTFRRILNSQLDGELESAEICPVLNEEENLSGQVIIRTKNGSSLEHNGITIELVGTIERTGEQASREDFIFTRLQLASIGESPIVRETCIYNFDFGNISFPYQSYDGTSISLRYFLKVIISRKLTDDFKEMTLWYPKKDKMLKDLKGEKGEGGSNESSPPIELDVGLEEFLHIKMRLDKSSYDFTEQVTGVLQFLLVRVRVVDLEVSLIRKEILANQEVSSQVTLLSKQILDGPAYRGDSILVNLDLASIATTKLSPTMINVHKTFSVCHFIGVILRDAEGRKYYKQVEVLLEKPTTNPSSTLLFPSLPEFKIGLVSSSSSLFDK